MYITRIAGLLLALALSFGANARTIEMEVNGLVCAFCAQGIEKTLKGFDATQAVLVSLERRLVAVALKNDTDIADDVLRKALTDAGYTVVAIRRTDTPLDTLRAEAKAHE